MKSRLTRRSFVKKASAGLAGISLLAASTKSLYAGAANKANMLAIHGGTPVRGKPFSETWPIIDEREEKALVKALKSRNWCCLRGNAVYDFEKMFAEAMNVPHCVLTNGGTTALSASLHVLGVGPGDEVITTPHTFIATINTITNLYALPVFVDIDPDTGSINADLIEAAITEHTKAIMPVHLAGWPVDIEKIMAICEEAQHPRDRGRLPVGVCRGQRQEGRDIRQDRLHQLPGMEVARLRRGRRDPRQRRGGHAPLRRVHQQRPRPEEAGERLPLPRLEPPHDRVPGRGAHGAVQTIPGAGPAAPRERALRGRQPGANPRPDPSQTLLGQHASHLRPVRDELRPRSNSRMSPPPASPRPCEPRTSPCAAARDDTAKPVTKRRCCRSI